MHRLTLEDLFETHDILRKIVSPTAPPGILTSGRLRFTSKRLGASVQAAGYSKDGIVQPTIGGRKEPLCYVTWWLVPSFVYAAIGINMRFPRFTDPRFWDDFQPTDQVYTYTSSWGYEVTTFFKTIFKGRKLTISHMTTARIIDAIQAALDYKRGWFIRFLLDRVGKQDAIKNIHWVGLEYVLRSEDTDLLAQYLSLFSKEELDATLEAAVQHNKPNLISWFMEHAQECEMDTQKIHWRIVNSFAQRMQQEKLDIEQSGLAAFVSQQLGKRKAETELVQGNTKRPRTEPVVPL